MVLSPECRHFALAASIPARCDWNEVFGTGHLAPGESPGPRVLRSASVRLLPKNKNQSRRTKVKEEGEGVRHNQKAWRVTDAIRIRVANGRIS
jgi:hypothetical protein